MLFNFVLSLLLITSDAFNFPRSRAPIIRKEVTELNIFSRRDAIFTGTAALFGVVASPQSSSAKETSDSIVTLSEPVLDDKDAADTPIDLNGAFVVMGYASLAGSIVTDGAFDSSELQGIDANLLEECSIVVDSNFASNIDVTSSVSDVSFLDGIEMYSSEIDNNELSS